MSRNYLNRFALRAEPPLFQTVVSKYIQYSRPNVARWKPVSRNANVVSLRSMQHLGLTVGRLPSERPMHMHFARIQGWRTGTKRFERCPGLKKATGRPRLLGTLKLCFRCFCLFLVRERTAKSSVRTPLVPLVWFRWLVLGSMGKHTSHQPGPPMGSVRIG